jgi:hypothetical protein
LFDEVLAETNSLYADPIIRLPIGIITLHRSSQGSKHK